MALPLVVAAGNGPDSFIWWHWVATHGDTIMTATRQHLTLTGIAIGLGMLISVPLALLGRYRRRTLAPILSVTGLLYTIPSLALFFLLGPFTGYASVVTAEAGLVSYTLLILIRNIVTGLDGVPAEVREAATGMGFTKRRQLWAVDLPLALPSIVAGLRIATVTTIGLVTIAAFVGQGGYGDLMRTGLDRDFRTPLVVGAFLSVLLAVTADLLLVGVQRVLTPWARRRVA